MVTGVRSLGMTASFLEERAEFVDTLAGSQLGWKSAEAVRDRMILVLSEGLSAP